MGGERWEKKGRETGKGKGEERKREGPGGNALLSPPFPQQGTSNGKMGRFDSCEMGFVGSCAELGPSG